MATKKKPNHEVRFGAIRASVWTNENLDGSRWFTLTLGRTFKDDQGNWQVAHHFKLQHLPDLARAVEAAHQWMEQHSVQPEAKTLVRDLVCKATKRANMPGGRSV
jgi:hypothetical protein